MAESDRSEHVDPEAILDPGIEAEIRSALARFGTDGAEALPPEVWSRIEQALAHESGVRAGTVIELAPRRRLLRWAGPLIAVSAVMLGVVVIVNLSGDANPGDVVALDPVAGDQVAAAVADGPADQPAAVAPTGVLRAGFVPAARTVIDSPVDFTPTSLRAGVATVLEQLGVRSPRDLGSVPATDMTASSEAAGLRECVTDLTESPNSQALIVLRATYNGDAVGVIIIPAAMMADASTVDLTRVSDPTLHIFVVDPGCGSTPEPVRNHLVLAIGQ